MSTGVPLVTSTATGELMDMTGGSNDNEGGDRRFTEVRRKKEEWREEKERGSSHEEVEG